MADKQTGLFMDDDEQPKPKKPASVPPKHLARRGDPSTSHEGASKYAGSKGHRNHIAEILSTLTECEGSTAIELARRTSLRDVQVTRRMDELCKLGLTRRGEFRRCTMTGYNAVTWHTLFLGRQYQ